MADYAKLKVAELQAQLKERSLPHTGKKDELIARLQENDATKTTASDTAAPAAAAQEDEIDWEDDEAAQPAAPAAAGSTTAAPAETSIVEPKADTSEETPTNGASTHDAVAAAAPTEPSAPAAPSAQDLDAALQARLARIDKFVNKADAADVARAEEEKAKLMRLAKYKDSDENATAIANPKGMLDGALPEKRQKRGRGDGDVADRGGKRRQVGRGRGGPPRAERTEVGNGGDGGRAAWMSDKDREAAKRRAERFAKPTA